MNSPNSATRSNLSSVARGDSLDLGGAPPAVGELDIGGAPPAVGELPISGRCTLWVRAAMLDRGSRTCVDRVGSHGASRWRPRYPRVVPALTNHRTSGFLVRVGAGEGVGGPGPIEVKIWTRYLG